MAKKRTLNEYRQTKEYKLSDQGGTYNVPYKGADAVPIAEIHKQEKMNPSKYTLDDLEQAKCSIVEKILKHFDDTLFEMVCEEMANNYLFKADNYLTEAGYDIFEDEWFEFYHEHHGDILAQINQRFSS